MLRLIAIVATLCISAIAVDRNASPFAPPNFNALDDRSASAAADKIVADRLALEQNLTSQLNAQETPPKRKVLLIYALGHLRSRWAIASLINIVDFPAPWSDPKSDRRWGSYPVVDALTSIGDSAVFQIVRTLPTEKDPKRIHQLLMVIYRVEATKPGEARLQDALANARDDAAKQNLQQALTAYRELAAGLDHR
jgi:hypothetical protein